MTPSGGVLTDKHDYCRVAEDTKLHWPKVHSRPYHAPETNLFDTALPASLMHARACKQHVLEFRQILSNFQQVKEGGIMVGHDYSAQLQAQDKYQNW